MKILMRLFLIILVIFSYVKATKEFSSSYTKTKEDYKDKQLFISLVQAQQYQHKGESYADYRQRQEEIKQNEHKAFKKLLENQKDSLKITLKRLEDFTQTRDNKKWFESFNKYKKEIINSYNFKKALIRNKLASPKISYSMKEDIRLYKEQLDIINATLKKYYPTKSIHQNKFNQWKTKTTQDSKNIVKENKVPSKINITNNTVSKTTINSSNMNTIVKTKNINVSNKAKASIGSVSIGKDEDNK